MIAEDSTIHGTDAAATIELIKERARARRNGLAEQDGRKLALIVEGGAMRGVISCGALMALEELGLTDVFDEVYGASAGAINAAYFLAGQAAYATTMYYQDINNSRMIGPGWRWRLLDLDYLFDTVIARERRLRVENVLASRSQLFIAISDSHTGQLFLAHAQKSSEPLLILLKASGAMPLLYNRMVTVDGRECFDGGLINSIPILEAIDQGCTDLLVLLTRPASFRGDPPTAFERRAFKLRCARRNPRLLERFVEGYLSSNQLRDLALGRSSAPAGVHIATICPTEMESNIERTTRDRQTLRNAAIASARRTLAAFARQAEEFVEMLGSYPPVAPL